MMKARTILIAGALAGAVACGGSQQPTHELASATAAVRAAHEVGADNVPQAELHLRLAQEEIARAQRQIKDDDNYRAELSLNRAKADAELALAIVRAHTSRQAALEAEKQATQSNQSSQVMSPQSNAQAER